jgi:hypothetical protein
MFLLVAPLMVLQAGCYNPDLADTAFSCQSDQRCPSGFFCGNDGCCHRDGSPDGTFACLASPPDAGPDGRHQDRADLPVDAHADLPVDFADGAPDVPVTDVGPDAPDLPPTCQNPTTDCPDPGNECILAICVQGQCSTRNVDDGTVTQAQTPGDCKQRVCDGAGGTRETVDRTDVEDDNQSCTTDSCDASGQPQHDPVGSGTSCTENGGKVCDDSGHCVECNGDPDCSAPTPVCDVANNVCVPMQCQNGTQDGMETDQDCGGPVCGACLNGKNCLLPRDCQSLFCNSQSHCAACTADTDCDANQFCDTGVCVPDLGVGDSCQRDAQCPGNNCVDTFCCDSSCTGTCMSCRGGSTGGTDGHCAPVSNGTDPDNECTTPPADSCSDDTHLVQSSAAGTCGGGQCNYNPTTVPCPNGCFSGMCNASGPSFDGDATGVVHGTTTAITLDKEMNLNPSTGSAPAGQDIDITVKVTPHNGVMQLVLKYTADEFTTTTPVTMTQVAPQGGDDVYRATIPGQTAGTTVRFFLDLTPFTGADIVNPGSNTNYTYVAN